MLPDNPNGASTFAGQSDVKAARSQGGRGREMEGGGGSEGAAGTTSWLVDGSLNFKYGLSARRADWPTSPVAGCSVGVFTLITHGLRATTAAGRRVIGSSETFACDILGITPIGNWVLKGCRHEVDPLQASPRRRESGGGGARGPTAAQI